MIPLESFPEPVLTPRSRPERPMPPELVGIVSDEDWILYRKIQRLVFDTVRKRGLVQKQQAEALRAFKHATHVKATRAAKERSIRLQTLRSLGEQIRQKAQQTS